MQKKLTLKYPSSWHNQLWREALPSGNGRIGACVYGAIKEETVLINHEALWHLGKRQDVPDVSSTLAQTRKMMDEGNFREASWNLTNALKDTGYNVRLGSPLPLVDLKVSMPCEKGFKKYLRELDMSTGEVLVKWTEGDVTYKRILFVSRADDVVVYKISADKNNIDARALLDMHRNDVKQIPDYCKEIEQSIVTKVEDNYIYYSAKNDDDTYFGAVAKIVSDGSLNKIDDNKLGIKNAKDILIFVKVFVKENREDAFNRLAGELEKLSCDYDALLDRHIKLHKPLFESADFSLNSKDSTCNEELLLEAYSGETPDEMIEKMWAYGRYLFVSATSNDGLPFPLYGLWHGEYNLIWCHNMANENLQMIYWHATCGNLNSLNKSLFNYYNELMPDFRDNAKNLYGCRGIYIPAGTTPGIGVPNQIVPVIMNWTGCAGWLARHYYEYWLYTGDEDFLINSAIPFMYEAALFYEDFLIKEENGKYKCYPSVSPENTPENFMPTDGRYDMAHPMPTTINSTMDIAIIKELLTSLKKACSVANIHNDKFGLWEDILNNLPEYTLNSDGAVREWLDTKFDDRYDHRHLSHIYPVFPGQEVNGDNNKELFDAFYKAVKLRKLGAQTGWSLMHMACIYARFNDGDLAIECIDNMSRASVLNNFYTLHNDWRNMGISLNMQSAPIQMDANMGLVNAVQEMLMFSGIDVLALLPALPKRWKKGSFSDFCFGYGKVNLKWDMGNESLYCEIKIERGGKTKLILPNGFKDLSVKLNGERITVKQNKADIFFEKDDIITIN